MCFIMNSYNYDSSSGIVYLSMEAWKESKAGLSEE
jgi:hypothetical protein